MHLDKMFTVLNSKLPPTYGIRVSLYQNVNIPLSVLALPDVVNITEVSSN